MTAEFLFRFLLLSVLLWWNETFLKNSALLEKSQLCKAQCWHVGLRSALRTRAKRPEKKETTRVCYLYIKETKWPILVVRTLKKQMTIKGQTASGALEQNGPSSSVKSLTCEFKASDGPLDLTHQTKALFILKQNVGIVRFESEQHLQKKNPLLMGCMISPAGEKSILHSSQCCVQRLNDAQPCFSPCDVYLV